MMVSDLILFKDKDDVQTAKAGDKLCLTVGNYTGTGRNLVLMFDADRAAELVADFMQILNELEKAENVTEGGEKVN